MNITMDQARAIGGADYPAADGEPRVWLFIPDLIDLNTYAALEGDAPHPQALGREISGIEVFRILEIRAYVDKGGLCMRGADQLTFLTEEDIINAIQARIDELGPDATTKEEA